MTGPGPLWTSTAPARDNPRWKPSAPEFARFAHAVATRYRDQVDRYLLWNEPNSPGWLQPQRRVPRGGVCTPVSPHLYRVAGARGDAAIHAADPGSEVLLGELAPIGKPARLGAQRRRPAAAVPARAGLRRRDVQAAARRALRGLQAGAAPTPSATTRIRCRNAPDQPNPDRDEAQIADLPRLFAVLDKLRASAGCRDRGGVDVLPDRVRLPDLAARPCDRRHARPQQTRYLQQASYIAWRSPRVRSLSFYQWDDEPVICAGPGRAAYTGWQTRAALRQRQAEAGAARVPAAVRDRRRPARAGRASGARSGRERRADGHGAAPAARARRCSGAWRRCRPTRAATGPGGSRSSGGAKYRFRWRKPP